jgi:outer membrane protein assembly factor BamD
MELLSKSLYNLGMQTLQKIALSLFIALFLSACATKSGFEKYENESIEQIFKGADTDLVKGDYKEAIERYESIQVLYPYGDYTQQTALNLLYVYYSDRQYDATVAAADRYIHLYPQGPSVDYAYYLKALSGYTRNIGFFEGYLPVNIAPRQITAFQEAFEDFNALVTRFPDSFYAPDARQHMIAIRNLLAQHDLEIANYYFVRKAYLAAAERGNEIVNKYQNAPQVADALVMMIKSYRALGLNTQAEQTLAILQLNYPNKKVK